MRYYTAGDTSRAEALQVGSGRPRRRRYGRRPGGREVVDFVVKTGMIGMTGLSHLQCIWGVVNDFSSEKQNSTKTSHLQQCVLFKSFNDATHLS